MKPHDLIFIVLGQYLIHLYNGLRRETRNQPSIISTLGNPQYFPSHTVATFKISFSSFNFWISFGSFLRSVALIVPPSGLACLIQ